MNARIATATLAICLATLGSHPHQARVQVSPNAATPPVPILSLPDNLDSLDVNRVVWSHDGRWLAFTATYNKQTDIYVARDDGSQLRRITDASPSFRVGQLNLSWLPKDQGLLTLGERSDSAGRYRLLGLYRLDRDGSNLAALASPVTHAAEGDVSPDGSQVVFGSKIDQKHRLLFLRDIDGTHVRRLTTVVGPIQFDANPAWSPDGHTIVFDSIRDSTGEGAIYRINADGTDERQLTTNAVNNALPTWSPDGKRLLWIQIANRRRFLVESDADGSHFKKLADDVSGSYSPDGRRIAGSGKGTIPQHGVLVILKSDGSDIRRVVLRPSPY